MQTIRSRANGPSLTRKYHENNYAPDWLTGAGTWIGIAFVVVAVVVFMVIGVVKQDDPSTSAGQSGNNHGPIQVNPAQTPSSSEAADEDGSSDDDASDQGDDYTVKDPVNVTKTGSDEETIEVPKGAKNLALAAVSATVNEDWEGVPSADTPPETRSEFVGATPDKESLTVTELGDNAYRFTISAQSKSGDTIEFTIPIDYGNGSYRVNFDAAS